MAIRKTAKNMKVVVLSSYNLNVWGKINKIAGKHNIESIKENIMLASNKKIVSEGNKK